MNNDTEEIKLKLNIVDVLGEYIKLDKAGSNWRALCPFHNEKSPSFMVNEEKQFWHCFGCQKSGDIFSFVMEMEGLEFREALKTLAEKAGVTLKNYGPQKTEEKNRTMEILELATKFYEVQLWKGDGKDKILKYLRTRGLTDETIKEFRLGYAPRGWRNCLDFLTKREYKKEEIAKTGLLVKKDSGDYYDRFRDRIIFPIADYSGRVVGYSARVAPGGDETQAKYVNTPETEVYHKSRILFGLDKAKSVIKKEDSVLLVEGNMDVIAASQVGIKNVVAVSGTALTEEQVSIIKRYAKNVKMFFDMDSAGEAATKKSVKLCLANNLSVKVVTLPQGKDAADLAKDNSSELKAAVENSLSVMDYFFQKTFSKFDKKEAEGKKKITDEILEIILSLENEVEKSHWIKKLSEELGVPEVALTDSLKKVSLRSRIEEKSDKKNSQSVLAKSKKEVLLEEIIGLMLVSSDVWKEAVKKAEEGDFSAGDSLLKLMLGKGAGTNFDRDTFLVKILTDRILQNRLEKIYFAKKYQLDLNNNLEEISLADPLKDFQLCLRELFAEEKKQQLMRLAKDLKIAEEKKDQSAVVFLREEFNKISKELTKLID